MAPPPALTQDELETALPQLVTVLRTITGAMASGVGGFGLVVVYAYLHAAPKAPSDAGLRVVALLSAGHAVLAAVMVGAGSRLCAKTLAPERIALAGFAASVQTAEILRLAFWEAPAMLGLVTCFLGALNGVLAAQPLYWLNASTAVLFVWNAASLFPSPERYRELFRALQAPR